jgi:hypothetical protein
MKGLDNLPPSQKQMRRQPGQPPDPRSSSHQFASLAIRYDHSSGHQYG